MEINEPPSGKPRHNWLKRIVTSLSRHRVDHDSLNQFVVKLRSDMDLLTCDHGDTAEDTVEVRRRIDEEFQLIEDDSSFEKNWNRANHIQKLIVSMYSPSTVDIELQLWLERSRRDPFPGMEFFDDRIRALSAEPPTLVTSDEERMALLLALVDNAQQVRSHHYIKMRFAKQATARVGVVFSLSLVFFLLTMSIGHWHNFTEITPSQEDSIDG